MLVTPEDNYKIVKLDQSLARTVSSILQKSYYDEPTYRNLLDADRPGYKQRLRATIREFVNFHFSNHEPVYGVLNVSSDQILGVALVIENRQRVNFSNNIVWRFKMFLTTGFESTRKFMAYQEQIRKIVPTDNYKIITLLGIDPRYRNKGLGSLLINTIHEYCDQEGVSTGIYLDSGNPKYDHFYLNVGYSLFTRFSLESVEESVYMRPGPVIA